MAKIKERPTAAEKGERPNEKERKNGRVDKQAKGLIQNKDAKMAKCKEEGQRPDTK